MIANMLQALSLIARRSIRKGLPNLNFDPDKYAKILYAASKAKNTKQYLKLIRKS